MFTQQFFSAFKAHVHISKSFQPIRLMFTQQFFSAFKAHVHISKSFQPVSLVWVFLFLDQFSLVWLILKLFSIKLFSPMCLIHGCLQPKRLMSGLCCKPPMPAIKVVVLFKMSSWESWYSWGRRVRPRRPYEALHGFLLFFGLFDLM